MRKWDPLSGFTPGMGRHTVRGKYKGAGRRGVIKSKGTDTVRLSPTDLVGCKLLDRDKEILNWIRLDCQHIQSGVYNKRRRCSDSTYKLPITVTTDRTWTDIYTPLVLKLLIGASLLPWDPHIFPTPWLGLAFGNYASYLLPFGGVDIYFGNYASSNYSLGN